MIKITQQMIEVSQQYGIKYANGDISIKETIEKVFIQQVKIREYVNINKSQSKININRSNNQGYSYRDRYENK